MLGYEQCKTAQPEVRFYGHLIRPEAPQFLSLGSWVLTHLETSATAALGYLPWLYGVHLTLSYLKFREKTYTVLMHLHSLTLTVVHVATASSGPKHFNSLCLFSLHTGLQLTDTYSHVWKQLQHYPAYSYGLWDAVLGIYGKVFHLLRSWAVLAMTILQLRDCNLFFYPFSNCEPKLFTGCLMLPTSILLRARFFPKSFFVRSFHCAVHQFFWLINIFP